MSVKILVIDEDRKFARQLVREGRRQGAEVDWFPSFADVGRIGRLGDYDCVIADLSSGPVTGIEIAQYATAFFSDLPVLLVGDEPSRDLSWTAWRFPPAVQARIPRDAGAAAVMQSALDMCVVAEAEVICSALPRARTARVYSSA
jgi:CheY-like chemotaxis protein